MRSRCSALRPWCCNLGPEISDTLSVRGYVVPLSIWMLWGQKYFVPILLVKKTEWKLQDMASARPVIWFRRPVDLVCRTERQSTRHVLRTEEDSNPRRRSLLAHVFRNWKSIFRFRLWRISSIEWIFVLKSRSTLNGGSKSFGVQTVAVGTVATKQMLQMVIEDPEYI